MDEYCNEQFDVAWILSSPYHHEIAASVFDETYYHTLRSASSNAIYTAGRVGQHRVVVASRNSVDISSDNEDFVDNLLREFPDVRAGFLVSTDAEASRNGPTRVGDIVFGTKPDFQSGTVYLDARQTKQHERLFITGQAKHIPESAALAVEDFLGRKQRGKWPQYLDQDYYPLHHRILRGLIASSGERFDDPLVLDRIGPKNDILCFDTAAASMRSHSFILVAGIASRSDDQQYRLSSAHICRAVVWYLSGLVRLISPAKLGMEQPLTSYFQYEVFDLEHPGFRLVRLEAGSRPDPIRCHLFQAYLDDEETLIPYEALSYCWGSGTSPRHTVLVNGGFLFVTENLFEALEYLREPGEDRILWVDALCIDQSNIKERGHQVAWMGKVYENAERVLFWLGHVPYDCKDLVLSLNAFKREVPREAWVNWTLDDSRWSHIWTRLQTHYLRRSDKVDLPSKLKSMMRSEWFSRVWVLQEVTHAQKALLGCSEGWVDAMAFAMAPRLLSVKASTQCQAVIDIMPGPSRRTSWWAQKSNICILLWRFRESQASDPRDRLFALLGLASDMKIGDESIVADYTKTESAVVGSIAKYLFNDSMQNLAVECLSDLQKRIPNLAAITLEQMLFSGSNVEDLHRYMQKQNPTVWLSEAIVNYTWFRRSYQFEYIRTNPGSYQVVFGQIPSTGSPEDTTSLGLFLNRHNGQMSPSEETIELFRRNSINMVVEVLRKRRQDVKITEPLVLDAARMGSNTLRLLLNKRGNEVIITESLIEITRRMRTDLAHMVLEEHENGAMITDALVNGAGRIGPVTSGLLLYKRGRRKAAARGFVFEMMQHGYDAFQLLLDRCANNVKFTETHAIVAIQKGYCMFRLLLDRRKSEIHITASLLEAASRAGSETLRLLLDKPGDEVKITDGIVEPTPTDGSRQAWFSLKQCKNQVKVTRISRRDISRADRFNLIEIRAGQGVIVQRRRSSR
ncbi:HET-domain-containing protein [Colletotrichum falcatum]|nr:HET-domain-containing protein [Colletotrichum falcatum]